MGLQIVLISLASSERAYALLDFILLFGWDRGGPNDFLRLQPQLIEKPVDPPRENCKVIPVPSKANKVEEKNGTGANIAYKT